MNLNEENPPMAHTHTVNYSILGVPGAVLSYLVPGLGQIIQGRISKGLLFFFLHQWLVLLWPRPWPMEKCIPPSRQQSPPNVVASKSKSP